MSAVRFKPWTATQASRKTCSFCLYANKDTSRTLLYRDDKVVAFTSSNPRAAKHLLVVPKLHYNTTADLLPLQIPLLTHMLRVGKTLLDPSGPVFSDMSMRIEEEIEGNSMRTLSAPENEAEDEANGMRFGFHRPPFHSVDHLHMHCFLLPFSHSFSKVRYWPGSPWFVSTRRLIQDLAEAKEVSVAK